MALPFTSPEDFGKAFVFKRFRPNLRRYFLKAGIIEVPYKLFGIIFYLSIIITAVTYLYYIYPLLATIKVQILGTSFIAHFISNSLAFFAGTVIFWIAAPLAIVAVIVLVMYFYLDLRIYNRTKRMEDVLPDFLRFVSENLKGGMSFERALWSSIKPEFDVLASEVRLAAKKVMTGQDVEEALTEFTDKYDSPIMRRAFELIQEGMKGGGRIADLIDKIIEDIEEMKELKAEMKATNLSYVIFVTFVVIIVAPGLFTLSFQFLTVLQKLGEKLAGADTQQAGINLPISFGNVSIDTETFKSFSRYALAIISGFSSIIVSIINKGNIKGGIKLIPIYVAASLVAYTVFMYVASSLFANLF
ncbi:type II secretion system F family protein [Candidatus Woesearchaeota archaeon]|nr:type II secretion system F family protein [Candidatus Woesearchaeota archaeon]